jgi:hypothetical protein
MCGRPKRYPALGNSHGSANVHDSKVLEEAVDAIEPIRKPSRGRPRKRPVKLHAYTRLTTSLDAAMP